MLPTYADLKTLLVCGNRQGFPSNGRQPRMSTTQLLVVDDDARYAQSVCELLRLDGHSVECEVDGARALQRIGVGDIAVLILDLDMPGVSGIDVMRAVQTRMSGLKTIIVSGSADIDKIAPVLRFSPFD